MQKLKNQKLLKEFRKKIKTYNTLLQNSSLLPSVNKDQIYKLRLLRIFTSIQINHIIYTYISLLQKTNIKKFEELKIGIIGGGVMGRLILNNLIIFQKQGFKTQNISVSTRQPQSLDYYKKNFFIQTCFDNENVMQTSDITFIATPSTLDNWILVDLKESFEKRLNLKGLKPLIFILTSNTTLQKCQNIYGLNANFMVPFINFEQIDNFFYKNYTFFQLQDIQKMHEIIQNQAFRQFQKSAVHYYNILTNIFTGRSTNVNHIDEIDQKSNQSLYHSLFKPSLLQNYMIKCKRWRSAYYNFVS